ncbi:MAG: MBL fold metallo-hydrolase [Dehalococcoidia bacterium]|nr:MAG: MBL fold metallo-hydrolase [Dehalococcoidia bacterium]UCG83826.1 MAG: MBL fold metallo-hydrolase [Dehalococcoidia bacterium]
MIEPLRIWKDVYLVGDSEISHPYDCCVYLVDAGDLVLIDSGAGRSFDKLVANIERLEFDPSKLKAVLVTHAHIDHIGALHLFQQDYGIQVIAHELDADAIEDGRGTAAEAYGVSYTPCRVDVRIQGSGESLSFGRHELKVIHIPGHTPGSIAAYIDIDNKRVLFGQDVHGPYLPNWGADRAQAKLSLQRLIELKADILCEGHFGIYQPASEVEGYIQGYIDSL